MSRGACRGIRGYRDRTVTSERGIREAAFRLEFTAFPRRRTNGWTPEPGKLNPSALAVPDVARLLTRAGGVPVTEEMLHDDVAHGAPTNPDGTLNLVHYTAWQVRELKSGD